MSVTDSVDLLSKGDSELLVLLAQHARWRDRREEGLLKHLEQLRNMPAGTLDCVLFGDSMLARFEWNDAAKNTKIRELPNTFNAGVGGDTIQNMINRLGKGSLDDLIARQPKLWVKNAGTNNLSRSSKPDLKGSAGLKLEDIEAFKVMLAYLLRLSNGVVLVTGISYRTDVADKHVDTSDGFLKVLCTSLNNALGCERVFWSEAPKIDKDKHLEDHVHFNEEGHRMWDETLYGKIQELLQQ